MFVDVEKDARSRSVERARSVQLAGDDVGAELPSRRDGPAYKSTVLLPSGPTLVARVPKP